MYNIYVCQKPFSNIIILFGTPLLYVVREGYKYLLEMTLTLVHLRETSLHWRLSNIPIGMFQANNSIIVLRRQIQFP